MPVPGLRRQLICLRGRIKLMMPRFLKYMDHKIKQNPTVPQLSIGFLNVDQIDIRDKRPQIIQSEVPHRRVIHFNNKALSQGDLAGNDLSWKITFLADKFQILNRRQPRICNIRDHCNLFVKAQTSRGRWTLLPTRSHREPHPDSDRQPLQLFV